MARTLPTQPHRVKPSSRLRAVNVLNPANYVDRSQRAMLDEYLGVYCLKPEEARKDPVKYSAQGALMSRLTIKAGLGSLALLEYAKCKVAN